MTCPTDEVLAAWAANALAGAERDVVESHAASCAVCRGVAIALAGVVPHARPERALGAEGATIGRYRVVGPAGHGAMGVVLRGHDPVLDREVAIKMIHAADATDDQRARMLREAQVLAKIDHANVVRVHDAGLVGDEVFVAMGYVTGPTLARWLAEPRPLAARVAVLRSVGEGIAAVHDVGLVHRDVKPENIVVDGDAGVLVDFGLARPLAAIGATGSGVAGTPRYLAPETRSGGAATPAADQFAWWTVVAETLADTRRRALHRAIARGTASDPAARFASMRDAIAALDVALASRRRRWPWVIAATAAVAGLAIALVRPTGDDDECVARLPTSWVLGRAPIEARLVEAGADAPRVVAAIDARARATASLTATACEAARGASADDRAHALRQELCLAETWTETERIFQGLVETQPNVVHTAVDDLINVLPVDRCAGGTIPAVPARPPAARAGEAAALEAELRSLRLGPRMSPGERIAKLRALEPRIRAIGYPPMEETWHVDIGAMLAASGDDAGARRELEAALALAESGGDDDARTRALINLLRNAFASGARDTAALERSAEAAAARLGNPAITAQLRMSEGMARYGRGDLAGALAAMQDAQRLLESVAIDAHEQLVAVAQNLGSMQQVMGDLDGAQRTLDRGYALALRRWGNASPDTLYIRGARAANLMFRKQVREARGELAAVADGLERTLGPKAAQVAQSRGFICEADLALEDAAASLASCDAALAATERALGPDHPGLAWPLQLVGRQRIAAHRPADAIAPLERALAVTAQDAVAPTDRPGTQGYLAIALRQSHRDPARALSLARDALAALRPMPSAQEAVRIIAAAFPELR